MQFTTLNLFTHELEKQKEFYSEVLGFELIDNNRAYFTLQIGATTLKFQNRQKGIVTRYHFAIGIPKGSIEATKSLLENTIFLMLSPKTANEVFSNDNWNSKSIYFYDVAGNIVELIESNIDDSPFTEEDVPLLNICEIGVASSSHLSLVEELKHLISIDSYDTNFEETKYLGTANARFAFQDINTKWQPTPFELEGQPFSCNIELNGDKITLLFNGKNFVIG
jgi:catechol 2,3-dioxygenase-like lactoylglutathione lyase family enzyme